MKIIKVTATALVLSFLTIFLPSCASESGSTPATEKQAVEVQRGNIQVTTSASGNLEFSREKDLKFETSGTVDEVLVEEGDQVKEGQVLARLDLSEWESELRTLKLSVIKAKINLKSAELALEKAVYPNVTRSEVDLRKLQVEEAKASLEDAQQTLANFKEKSPEVVAPFDGIITTVNVTSGDKVNKGSVAMQLADPRNLK